MNYDSSETEKLPLTGSNIFLGAKKSFTSYQGIDYNDLRVLRRKEKVEHILTRLETRGAILVKSPPMSGKTSLAFLLSHFIHQKYVALSSPSLVINMSILNLKPNGSATWDFQAKFKEYTGIDFLSLENLAKSRRVYLIIDETQLIYRQRQKKTNDGKPSSPEFKSKALWELIKEIMNDTNSNIRVLLLSAHGSSPQNGEYCTPVEFQDENVMGIEELLYSDDEIRLYLNNYFNSYSVVADSNIFFNQVKLVTGANTGLVYTLVHQLNCDLLSEFKRNEVTKESILASLTSVQTYQALQLCRAVTMVDLIDPDELTECRSILYGESVLSNTSIASSLVRKGILVDLPGQKYAFSNNIIEKKCLELYTAPIARSSQTPQELVEFIRLVLSNLNYSLLKDTYGRSAKSRVLLERSWQMEFYSTSLRCTPSSWIISADVGSLFKSSGSIDFTLHDSLNRSVFWGVELLRDGDRLEEHIGRFGTKGRYASLVKHLSDYCLVDFRLDQDLDSIRESLHRCERLIVVNYVCSFSEVYLHTKDHVDGLQLQSNKL